MKLLITGATGLLGGNLARHFASQGCSIRALIRSSPGIGLQDVPITVCQGDLLNIDDLRQAVQGVDWVIHAGAFVHIGKKRKQDLFDVNVQGTRNLCQAMVDQGIEKMIHVSTVDTLGMQSLENPADEETKQDSKTPTSRYGQTKLAAEKVIDEFIQQGLHVPIVLPCYMLGAWDPKPSSGQMLLEIAQGKGRFPPKGGNNFIHVNDVCVGIKNAMQKGKSGRRYIMGNRNMTYFEAWTLISEIIDAPKPITELPDWVINSAAVGMDILGSFSAKEGVLNSVSAKLGMAPHYYDSSRALRELELPQTPIEQAVEDAWDWFKEHGFN